MNFKGLKDTSSSLDNGQELLICMKNEDYLKIVSEYVKIMQVIEIQQKEQKDGII